MQTYFQIEFYSLLDHFLREILRRISESLRFHLIFESLVEASLLAFSDFQKFQQHPYRLVVRIICRQFQFSTSSIWPRMSDD